MSATPPEDTGYIRGGAGVPIDLRRVARAIAVLVIAGLLAATVVTTMSAADQNSRNAELRHAGVPVVVTVTGCTGYGSGIAQATNYYQCRGTYALGDHQYDEVIGGLRSQVPAGRRLAAVAVRGDPASVTTASSVAKPGSTLAPYLTPIALGALALALAIGLVVTLKRRA